MDFFILWMIKNRSGGIRKLQTVQHAEEFIAKLRSENDFVRIKIFHGEELEIISTGNSSREITLAPKNPAPE